MPYRPAELVRDEQVDVDMPHPRPSYFATSKSTSTCLTAELLRDEQVDLDMPHHPGRAGSDE
jgi:hypothetical protein